MPKVIDLFAGPGGWSVACRRLHLDEAGIEIDPTACRTRQAAGFDTIEGSVTDYGPADFPECVGLIASPPCQLFSTAGKGAARKLMPEILEAIAAMGRGDKPDTSGWPDGAKLVLEPLRWAIEAINLGRPYEWIALEQVPPVLPVWAAMADVLRHGYGVATGNLQAEMFGVPQTRKRAVLVARLDGPARLPAPTHSRYYPRDPQRLDPGVPPWVSMATALGWDKGAVVRSNYSAPSQYPGQTAAERGKDMRSADLPSSAVTSKIDRNIVYRSSTQPNSAVRSSGLAAPTIAFGHDSASAGWVLRSDNRPNSAVRDPAKPAPTILGNGERGTHAKWVTFAGAGRTAVDTATTVNGDARIAQPGRDDPAVPGSQYGAETVRVTVQEAAILQSFPADYPWTGDPAKPNGRTSQYQMVGNAIPPLLAEAILRAASEVR